jgi:BirA family biotin operon repressor/biotin-[acetyl-CoA-carboxylase] ligase
MLRLHFDSTDSTNTQARRLAAERPGERLLVTANTQSAGRGRHGRAWQSPRGGAWMSIVWPLALEPRAYAPVSLVAAVAVRRAAVECAGDLADRLSIKWPNDLLVGDAKVAGILCEQFPGHGTSEGAILVIGIGVNVDFDAAQFPAQLRYPATTLAVAAGRPIDVEDVIAAVSRHVVDAVGTFERDGLPEMLRELRDHLAYVGTVRTWSSPRGHVTGCVMGIDQHGRLLVQRGSEQLACEVGEFVPDSARDRREAARLDSPGRRPG